MSSSIWVSDTQQKIYATVTYRANKALKSIPNTTNYDKLNFTQETENINVKINTPTVLIQELPIAEQGKDLERCEINGFNSSFQIDVSVSKTQGISVARRTIYEVIDQFKKMQFDCIQLPKAIETGNADIKRMTAKVSRNISKNDFI